MIDYVIDFDRINELTVHKNDSTSSTIAPSYYYGVTRGLIKEYIRIYMDHLSSRHTEDEKFKEAVNVLHWNRILISTSEIRDSKIDDIIEQKDNI